MRALILFPLLVLLACSIPGMEEFNTRMDDLKGRLDDLEQASQNEPQVDLTPIEQRISAIESILSTSGIEVSPEASAELSGAFASLDSISAGLVELGDLVEASQDSLTALSGNARQTGVQLDSLQTRIAALETEISDLQDTVEGLRASGGSSGSSGGTSRGGSSGGSGRGGTSGGGTSGGGTSGGGTGR
jgi:prefoldin subunit 5